MSDLERSAVHRFALASRSLLAAAATSRPRASVWDQASDLVDQAVDLLTLHCGPQSRRIYGQVREFAGRGQVLAPAISVLSGSDDRLVATVTLDTFYLGRGGAHGGVPPLLFDEAMSQLANAGERSPSRTAYLNVDYRAVTPVDRPLRLEAEVLRVEGRKCFVSARLLDDDRLLCEAEALFVRLRPDQP